MRTQSVHPAQQLPAVATTLPGFSHTKRSSKLTAPGFLFVFVTLFLALGAINGQNNLLFWLFGFSIAALIVSGIITGTALVAIRLTAHPLEATELGSYLKPRYTIHNTSRLFPNFAMELVELDAPGFSKSTPEHSVPGIALHLSPRSHASTQSRVTPMARGMLTLDRVRVRSSFPFGLFSKSIEFSIPRQVVILPRRISLKQTQIDRLIASDESAITPRNLRGSGLDYFALRQYQKGDPIRTIAWKQSARSESVLVTEYPEPATDQLILQIAMPSHHVDEELFERAISLTYSIIRTAPLHTRIALDIPWAMTFIPPASGAAHLGRCARALALLDRPISPSRSHTSSIIKGRSISIGYARSKTRHGEDLYAEDFRVDEGVDSQ